MDIKTNTKISTQPLEISTQAQCLGEEFHVVNSKKDTKISTQASDLSTQPIDLSTQAPKISTQAPDNIQVTKKTNS